MDGTGCLTGESARARGLKPNFCGIGVNPVSSLCFSWTGLKTFELFSSEDGLLEESLDNCCWKERSCELVESTGRRFGGDAASSAERSRSPLSRVRGKKLDF
jgi:hypothetical protein